VITVGVVFFIMVMLVIYAILKERRTSRQLVTEAESILSNKKWAPARPITMTGQAVPKPILEPLPERAAAAKPIVFESGNAEQPRIPDLPFESAPQAEGHLTRPDRHLNRPVTAPSCLALLSDADYDWLMSAALIRTYRSGETILNETEDTRAFCLLLSGRVGLLTVVGEDKRLLAGTVKPGRIFAWSGLVSSHHFTTTAHAMEDSEVAVFRDENVRRLCAEHPDLGFHLMEEVADAIADRLYEHDLRLSGLMGPRLPGRE
jgi:CRP-like cAMP-binding protein